MSAHRLIPVLALLLASCAAWDSAAPSNSAPPAETPTPSHYAPPPPGTPPGPDAAPVANLTVAIASVQLLQDCPDPAPAGAPAAAVPAQGASIPAEAPTSQAASRAAPSAKRSAGQAHDSDAAARRMCTQSTVQLSVRADVAGTLKIEEVRVLDASSKKLAGPAKLRLPTQWNEADGTYTPWDERTVTGKELKISYKLADPDMSQASTQVGPDFNTYIGPFVLELVVSFDGKKQTIQSAEFSREPPHLVVT